MIRRKLIILLAALMALLLLSSCDAFIPAEDVKPEATAAVIIKPIEVKAADTPTPEPVIVVRDPVKAHSAMRIQQDVPADAAVPVFYQAIDLDGVNHVVFAFTTTGGKTEYRVYAQVDELEDENVMNTLEGFFKAEIYRTESGYFIKTNKDENPINISSEIPCKITPCSPPTKNNVQNYIRNMTNEKKKYEQAVAQAQKKNEPAPEPTPWDGLPVYTEETTIIVLPEQVRLVNRNEPTLYYYVNIYGENEYRRCATPNGEQAGFYLSNEEGKITPGSLMIDYEKDFVTDNFKKRTVEEKPEDFVLRLPVLIRLDSGEIDSVEVVY